MELTDETGEVVVDLEPVEDKPIEEKPEPDPAPYVAPAPEQVTVKISAGQLELIESLQKEEEELARRIMSASEEKFGLVLKSIMAGQDMKGDYRVVGMSKDTRELMLEKTSG